VSSTGIELIVSYRHSGVGRITRSCSRQLLKFDITVIVVPVVVVV